MSPPRAVVVGGGASGISAAFRLQQAGFAVRVLESDGHVGGRTRTERFGEFIVDVGAGILPGSYEAVQRLMRDAGQSELLDSMSAPTAVCRDGRIHLLPLNNMLGAILKTRLLGWRSKLLLAKIAVTALRMYSSLDFDNLGRAARHDKETLAAYAQRELNEELLEYLLNPVQKMMYVIPASAASVVDFFWCAKNLLHPKAYSVRGGMDRICTQIAQSLDVQLATRVTRVSDRGDHVEIEAQGIDGGALRYDADVCVIATPARVSAEIHAGLDADQKRFLAGLDYARLVDVHLFLKQRPQQEAVVVMVPDSVDRDLCGLVFEHNKGADRAPPGKGLVRLLLTDRWAREVFDLPDDEVYRRAIEKAARVMPEITGLVERHYVHRWDYVAAMSHPGCYAALNRFVASLDPASRIQLAGDFYALASVNTAVTSGERSAKQLIQHYRG